MDSRNGGSAIVPFNRLETSSRDFVAAFSCFWHSDPLAALREMLQEMTGQRPVILAPSGESAIAQVLLSLPQQEVVMPAYLCGEVRRAALIAGKRVIYVDLAKHSVNATSAEFAREAPVSYTHLDVYKRQRQNTALRSERPVLFPLL